MKNLIVILITFLLVSARYNLTYGQVTQEWVQRYNGPGFDNRASSIAVDGSGNVYVTGSSYGIGNYPTDYATIKYNSNGDSLWVRRYNGPGNGVDAATSIAVDGSGNVYVTGYSSQATGLTADYVTIKYNSNGDSLWVKRYNGLGYHDEARSIAVDGAGNVYVTGYITLDVGDSPDGFEYYYYATIKYNSSGVLQWVRQYKYGDLDNKANSIAVDGSGNVYVTGYSTGSDAYWYYATIKYNSNGDSLWVKRYKGPGNSYAQAKSIAVDGSGNVYVTGYRTGSDGYYYATIKYNSNGDSLWVKGYNGPGNSSDGATSIGVDGSGNVYVTGSSSGNGTGYDYATIKYNSNGDSLWVQRYNGPGNSSDGATSIGVDGSGNVYVTGYSIGSVSSSDYVTIKYNSNGDSLWVQRYNGPGNVLDYATSLAVDGFGNVYVTGFSYDNPISSDYATIKYSSVPTVPSTLHLAALIEGFYDNVTNKMIRDTVSVYLRNLTVPYDIVDLSQTVLDSTGNGTLDFFNASNSTPYYIVIEHRNSIETWSSGGNSFLLNNLSYDFTTAAAKAYGNNLVLKGAEYCIYSGDVNLDGNVDLDDVLPIYNDATNFVPGYVNTDVNGDMITDLNDVLIAFNNGNNFVSVVRP